MSATDEQKLVDLGYPPKLVNLGLLKKGKHEEAIKYGLSVMRQGFVKVDHFDNIYRLSPRFEGAPNLRQVCGYKIYGTGQPNKSAIISLCNIWFKQMKLKQCLWINMRSEPVIYVRDISLSARDPKHASQNIDFGAQSIITMKDLNTFNKALEQTVKANIVKDSNIFKYHCETYAPLPADRKDRVLELKCDNGSADVYGLQSLYKNLKKKQGFNIKLKRITVLDEKAPKAKDIVNIVRAIEETDSKTVIVFNCMMGKGRTTEGMIMATLIKQIQRNTKIRKENDKMDEAKQSENGLWPKDVPYECEEIVSFHKKIKKDEEKDGGYKYGDYALSVNKMKKGKFSLIKKLISLLNNKYKLDGNAIKKETDDVIDACQHLQNMRECIFLCLERYVNENRENEKGYWQKISRQYLERYYVLICFNAYLNDVVITQKKSLKDISYTQWISKKKSIKKAIGSLKKGALSKFNWD